MKIEIEKWVTNGSGSYKIGVFQLCCNEMINDKDIDLINATYDIEEDNCFIGTDIIQDEEYGIIHNYKKYNFCPYCGEPIEIKIVKTVDKTEEYYEIDEEKKLLWKKCRRTDSKKKAKELDEKIKELNMERNKILSDDSLSQFRKDEQAYE